MKLASALISAILCVPAIGSAASILITVDENGVGTANGASLAYNIGQDPGPGGLPNSLIYSLPFAGTVGDVELIEPETGIPGDVLRFNGNSTLVFDSAGGPGNTALADQPRPPFPVPNTVRITELSSDDAFYTPTSGQPGFDSAATVTYHFVGATTSAVPEPQSVALLLLGGFGLLAGKFRKSWKR